MYHFVADQHTQEIRLSQTEQISSKTTQYLKSFQLEGAQYIYDKLTRQDFCILNDEGGLGKSATIVALLSAIGARKKTLIILQNEEQRLVGWEFHFGVLSDLPVCVIQNSENTTDSAHNVYLAKWSILRSIGDLSKLKFDYIIVDHRGFTLNNHFCTSMLIKQFEKRVNIFISSVDITSDVKLLHNVLRLGGCLEHQYMRFKNFEAKFYLPEAKEVFSKRVDLEEYYRQREILGEYIKNFRLRRYCHQYEQYLPLVAPEQYKNNLTLWLASHNSNTTLSGTSSISTVDLRSTAGTEEIIECLIRIKKEREAAQELQPLRECTEVLEPSEEPLAMSPLIFESSESDVDDDIEFVSMHNNSQTILSDDDVVHVSSEELELTTPKKQVRRNGRTTVSEPPPRKKTVQRKKRNLSENHATKSVDKADNQCETPKRATRQSVKIEAKNSAETITTKKSIRKTTPNGSKAKATEICTPRSTKDASFKNTQRGSRQLAITPSGVHSHETRSMQRFTRSTENKLSNKYMTKDIALIIDKNCDRSRKKKPLQTPKNPKVTRQSPKVLKKTTPDAKVEKKKSETTPTSSKAGNVQKKLVKAKQSKKSSKDKSSTSAISQITVLCSSSNTPSECDFIQCAQKLPQDLEPINIVSDNAAASPRFRMPATPLAATQSQVVHWPNTASLLSNSEITFVSTTKSAIDVVVLSSSQDEDGSTQSRRTRALKRKRNQTRSTPNKTAVNNIGNSQTNAPTLSFGELLARQRSKNKSPDLFSSCSDILAISPAQQPQQMQRAQVSSENESTFEGFKIFGSEVKQFQQQHAKTVVPASNKKKSDRSCLDILEQMFEPRNKKLTGASENVQTTPASALRVTKKSTTTSNVLPTLPAAEVTRTLPLAITQRRRTIMDDDDIFEITNNGEFGGRLRLNSTGNVSPVQQTQQNVTKPSQHNKITNYLIGNATQQTDDSSIAESSPNCSTRNTRSIAAITKKSPKSLKSTQSTKLTRWFAASTNASGETVSAPTTPVESKESTPSEAARRARQNGPTKRKRLELFK